MVPEKHKPVVSRGPSPERAPPRVVSGLTALAGGALAVCFFLPAVQSCNHVYHPYEVPLAAGPYVFGLVTAAIAVAALVRRVPRWLRVLQLALLAAQTLLLGYGAHVELFDSSTRPKALELLMVGLFWPQALLTLRAYLPGKTIAWRTARATTGGGALMLLWFAPWARDGRFGLWLSIAASAALLLLGVVQEVLLAQQRSRARRPAVF